MSPGVRARVGRGKMRHPSRRFTSSNRAFISSRTARGIKSRAHYRPRHSHTSTQTKSAPTTSIPMRKGSAIGQFCATFPHGQSVEITVARGSLARLRHAPASVALRFPRNLERAASACRRAPSASATQDASGNVPSRASVRATESVLSRSLRPHALHVSFGIVVDYYAASARRPLSIAKRCVFSQCGHRNRSSTAGVLEIVL